MESTLVKLSENSVMATEMMDRVPTLKPGIYIPTFDDKGEVFTTVKPSQERNIADGTITDEILADMEAFLLKRDKFREMKFPHKRGYLLHGAPGCGKTSLIRLIADKFVKLGGVVLLSSHGSVQDFYNDVRKLGPKDAPILIVYEDMDRAAGQGCEESLVEFLDGTAGLESVLFIGTTNYLDRVPPRLRSRPSRIDRLIEVKLPVAETRRAYLRMLGCGAQVAEELLEFSAEMSFAGIKELFIATQILGHDAKEVTARIKSMTIEPDSIGGEMFIALGGALKQAFQQAAMKAPAGSKKGMA